MGKGGLPQITDKFMDRTEYNIQQGNLEGQEPKTKERVIYCKYKINTKGEVISEKGHKMKYIFRKGKKSPYVIIKIDKKDSSGNFVKISKEIRIDHMMDKHFGPYITNYRKKYDDHENKYIVVPKNRNREDMKLDNLEYIKKENYELENTKKGIIIRSISTVRNFSDENIAQIFGVSRSRANKVKNEATKNRLPKTAHKTRNIYKALIECNGEKTNLELAKELRPDQNFNDAKIQKKRTEKVVRVRRKLIEKGIIKKQKKTTDIKKELKKALKKNKKLSKTRRKRHAQIAKIFWITKTQVDNFSRSLKK